MCPELLNMLNFKKVSGDVRLPCKVDVLMEKMAENDFAVMVADLEWRKDVIIAVITQTVASYEKTSNAVLQMLFLLTANTNFRMNKGLKYFG